MGADEFSSFGHAAEAESEDHAHEQVAALPTEALPLYAEQMTVLVTASWGGEA